MGCLQTWIRSHKKAGIQPVISNPSRQAMHLLTKAGIPELIGEQFITVRVNDAVLLCQVRAPHAQVKLKPRMACMRCLLGRLSGASLWLTLPSGADPLCRFWGVIIAYAVALKQLQPWVVAL